MNIFKQMIFLQKEIKRQQKDNNHDAVKLQNDIKLLKHYQKISVSRVH
jgi:hypothetical protein